MLDPNSPEGMLAAAGAQLDTLKAENTKLRADLAGAKASLEKPEQKTLAASSETIKKLTASLQSANESNAKLRADLAAKTGVAASATPGMPADVAAIIANSGNCLSRAERDRLYEHLATLPVSEQHAFYKRHIGSKQEV